MQKTSSPLFIPTLFWITGIVVTKLFSPPIILVFALATFTLLLTVVFVKFRISSILLLLFLMGILNSLIAWQKPAHHLSNILAKHPTIQQPIVGKITSEVIKKDNYYIFDLQLSSIANHSVSGKIKLSTNQDSLNYADEISTIASIRKISKVANPAGFDLQEYYGLKSISAGGFSKTIIEIVDNSSSNLGKTIIKIRKFIRARIEKRCGKNSGFIKAILIADRSNIDFERNILSNAGLSHLLAVSGLHVAIIALLIYSIINVVIRNRYLNRIITIIILISYAAICNFSPSVSRAVIMISLVLISKMLNRKTDLLNILSLSLILITAINPNQLFSTGLQMSFAAVLTLGLFIPKIKRFKLPDASPFISYTIRIINGIILIMISSFVLSLFLAPITILNFNQFNLNGVIANIVGIPIISLILSLSVVVIFLPEFNFLLELYQFSLDFILNLFFSWTKYVSNFPFNWKFLSVTISQVFALYILLIIIFHRKSKLSLCLISSLMFIFILCFNVNSDNFEITYFDCGLGDLFLIRNSFGETILIDTGPTNSTSKHFNNSALPYLKQQKINSLDYLIITHAHNDHYGGLKSVLAELKVKNIVVTDEFVSRKIWKYFQNDVISEQANLITITDTTTIFLTDFSMKILHPDKHFADNNINNMSIVTKIEFDSTSFLFMGDLEEEGEHYLIDNYAEHLPADVLKAGHHGSRTACSEEFIKLVNPEFVILPTSLHNRFGFPHRITLDKFKYLEDHLLITGKDGAIQIYPNKQNTYIKTIKSGKEFIIKKNPL